MNSSRSNPMKARFRPVPLACRGCDQLQRIYEEAVDDYQKSIYELRRHMFGQEPYDRRATPLRYWYWDVKVKPQHTCAQIITMYTQAANNHRLLIESFNLS